MAKLALLSALVGTAFWTVASPAHACRGKDHCPTHRDEADDDTSDDDDDDGGSSSGSTSYHIHITGKVWKGVADEAPEPPPPPPAPRVRTRPVELELDVGRDEYLGSTARSDTRVGAALYVPLVAARVAPYLLAGAGVNFSYFSDTDEELHQGYLAGGGGVAFAASSRFTLDFDARYMLREFFEGDRDRDQALEMRISGIVYF